MRPLLAALAAATGMAPATAQAQEQRWVSRLGQDTVSIERFTMAGDRIDGEIVSTVPVIRRIRYTLRADGNGGLRDYHLTMERPGTDSGRVEFAVRWQDTAVAVIVTRPAKVESLTVAAKRPPSATFYSGFYSIGHLQPAISALLASGRDSLELLRYSAGSRTIGPSWIWRVPGEIRIGWIQGLAYHAMVDARGALTRVDGKETTAKTVSTPAPDLDFAAVLAAWIASARGRAGLGELSPRDTVRATIRKAAMWLDYGRPATRGRDVWRTLATSDTVWRSGANAATQWHTDQTLRMAGTDVPPGTYSVFSTRVGGAWHLILNRQHGQWGTVYDSKQDLARVPVQVVEFSQPVERLTYELVPTGTGGELRLSWDRLQWRVPFTVPDSP